MYSDSISGPECYEVYAIRFGTNSGHRSRNSFIDGDEHDRPMPIDYYVWVIKGASRVFLLDTGFSEEVARKRQRQLFRSPADGLRLIGIEAGEVEDVIVSHMHYDHCGNHHMFPRARYHVQDREMQFCTGRCMCHSMMRAPFDADDVASMVRKVFDGRVVFHDGASELAPGIVVHRIGGHTAGIQVVRVWTRRGWMVLASDVAHFYANLDQNRPISVLDSVADALEGFAAVRRLTSVPHGVIPGHDPLVMARYPAAPGLEGIVARLDLDPVAHALAPDPVTN